MWASDGTKAGTVLVKDIYSGTSKFCSGDWHGHCAQVPNSSNPSWLTNFNGTLFFSANDGSTGQELWKSDGTANGTWLVSGGFSNLGDLTVVGGALYFSASGGLWKSNGTAAGTVRIKTFVNNGYSDINPTHLTNVNGTLFFSADDSSTGQELWKSDGTAAGTVLVRDINPGSVGSGPSWLTNVNGTLFFEAEDSGPYGHLWKSDGTTAGTVLVSSLGSAADVAIPGRLTNVNGLLYFVYNDGVHGSELWQSDGTAAGTVMVQDIYPGSTGSDPSYLTAMNNKLYFSADDSVHGVELWDPPAVGATSAASSRGYLFVPVSDQSEVLRYDEVTRAPAPSPGNTGATFVPPNSDGLAQPDAVIVGPDGNLYVSSGFFSGFLAILRYDSTSGAPLPTSGNTGATFGDTATVFAQESALTDNTSPLTIRTILFDLDGNLYVAAGYDGAHKKGWVDRFDGTTGAYLGKFVTDDLSQNGGLKNPQGIVFGPDGKGDGKLDLYVASSFKDSSNNDVKRYDGTTGQFRDTFKFLPLH